MKLNNHYPRQSRKSNFQSSRHKSGKPSEPQWHGILSTLVLFRAQAIYLTSWIACSLGWEILNFKHVIEKRAQSLLHRIGEAVSLSFQNITQILIVEELKIWLKLMMFYSKTQNRVTWILFQLFNFFSFWPLPTFYPSFETTLAITHFLGAMLYVLPNKIRNGTCSNQCRFRPCGAICFMWFNWENMN